jgi:hypothetical protein
MQSKIWYSILGLDAMSLSLKNLMLRLHDFWTIFGKSEHSGPFDDGLAL